jgi:hypothetical protein
MRYSSAAELSPRTADDPGVCDDGAWTAVSDDCEHKGKPLILSSSRARPESWNEAKANRD